MFPHKANLTLLKALDILIGIALLKFLKKLQVNLIKPN